MTLLPMTDEGGTAVSHAGVMREQTIGYTVEERLKLPGARCQGTMEYVDRTGPHHVAVCSECGWSIAVPVAPKASPDRHALGAPDGW